MTEKAQAELAARTAATGQPTGILSPKEEGIWNKSQIDTLRQAYESQMRKGGSGVLIMGGQAEFQKLAFSPRELEFSSIRDYVRTATMSAFGVVPVRLGIESQNFATANNQLKLYWEGLSGRAALIDSELTRLARMFGDEDIHVKHDFSGVAVLQESRTDKSRGCWIGPCSSLCMQPMKDLKISITETAHSTAQKNLKHQNQHRR